MFETKYNMKYASSQYTRRRPRPKSWLSVFLVGCLLLFGTLNPVGTFSRYMVNLNDYFNLNTSTFYLTPSLAPTQLSYHWEDNFTEAALLTVTNASGSSATIHDTEYSITVSQADPTPLFDLYTDDGLGGKIQCLNNVINGTLAGGSANSDSYNLYFKLHDPNNHPANGNYDLTVLVSSSEPYLCSYSLTLKVQIEQAEIVVIPGTDIEIPNTEIPEGEILIFKDGDYTLLDADALLQPVVVDVLVDEMGYPDLVGASLYIPIAAGDLLVDQGYETISWDVAGNVVLEPDIIINNNNTVNITSRYGDVVFNGSTISGQPFPYAVNIIAENGSISGIGGIIDSKNDNKGQISLEAKNDIVLSDSVITSYGGKGLRIISEEGDIDVSNAVITATNGAATGSLLIRSYGQVTLDGAQITTNASPSPPTPALLVESINEGISAKNASLSSTNSGKLLEMVALGLIELDQASISSQGELIIRSTGDISAPSANLSSAGYGNGLKLSSTNGAIDISALEEAAIPQTIISSPGNIKIHAQGDILARSAKISAANLNYTIEFISVAGQIDVSSSQVAGVLITDITSTDSILMKAGQDISCISAKITASAQAGKQLRFESTGAGRILSVNNANLRGNSIQAVNLLVQGTPANGTIQPL
jgi:hypothetical protein